MREEQGLEKDKVKPKLAARVMKKTKGEQHRRNLAVLSFANKKAKRQYDNAKTATSCSTTWKCSCTNMVTREQEETVSKSERACSRNDLMHLATVKDTVIENVPVKPQEKNV